MKTPREKYLHDPTYHAFVDQLVACIMTCHFTPSELREMAILASILYEEGRLRSTAIPFSEELKKALKVIDNFVVEENVY